MEFEGKELSDIEICAIIWQSRIIVEESRHQRKLFSRIDTPNVQLLHDVLTECDIQVGTPKHLQCTKNTFQLAEEDVAQHPLEPLTYDEEAQLHLEMAERLEDIKLEDCSKSLLFRAFCVAAGLLAETGKNIPCELQDFKPLLHKDVADPDSFDRSGKWVDYCVALAEASQHHVYTPFDENGKMAFDPATGRRLPEIE